MQIYRNKSMFLLARTSISYMYDCNAALRETLKSILYVYTVLLFQGRQIEIPKYRIKIATSMQMHVQSRAYMRTRSTYVL